jgi:hypothetical protein
VSDLIARLAARAVDAPVAAPTGPRRATSAPPVVQDGTGTAPPPNLAGGETTDAPSSCGRPERKHPAPARHVATVASASERRIFPATREPEPTTSGSRPEDGNHPLPAGRVGRLSSGQDDRTTGATEVRTSAAPAVASTASATTTAGSEPPEASTDIDVAHPYVSLATATRSIRPPPAVGGSDDLARGHRSGESTVADVSPDDAPDPVVRVHIGRLDVRPVVGGRDRGRGPVATPDPGLSLAAYLRGQRDAP